MLAYFLIFINIILSQDYDNLESKNISPLLLNNSMSYNERIANNKSNIILNNLVDIHKYIVGPGDEFYISFSASNFSFNNYLVISPTGDIVIPSVGIINLNFLSLSEAFEEIKKSCNEKYSNSDVNITLTDIRSFYINIQGLTYGNSKILVNPLTTVVDAFEIFLSTVPNNKKLTVSKRKILLNDNMTIDYLLNKIEFTFNPYLKEGDILTISEYELYFDIYGGVKNPGRYEYNLNDNLSSVVKLAGGYSSYVANNAVITRIDHYNPININIDQDYDIHPYDHILINVDKNIKNRNLVTIIGEVNIPGKYIITNGMTINDLLEISGGYTENADTNKIIIHNEILKFEEDLELKRIKLITPSKRTMSEISYLKSRSIVNKGTIKSNEYTMTQNIFNYQLNIGDEINILPRIDYVEIIGAVNNPGRYPFINGNSINDYIKESGGKTNRAKKSIYIINSYNQKKKVRNNYTDIHNGEIIFVESKEDFNLWNKLQESMGLIGQLATLLAVIQSASNN